MMQERALLGQEEDDKASRPMDEMSQFGNKMNEGLFEDIDQEPEFNGKARFKEDDNEKLDLLKDIRKKQNEGKKKKKEEGKEGSPEDAAEGEKGESTAEGTEGEGEDEKFLEEDTGSVASSTKSLMKHLRMLRNALYENYSPPSIRNLKL